MPGNARVPRPTAQRLSLYLRELERLAAIEQLTVSSRQLGEAVGAADAQVRKDLGIIGHSGMPGIGYRVMALAEAIREVIGVHKQWRAALVGAGNIGRALVAYRSFHEQGFEIVAVFDASATVVGRTVAQLRVRPMTDLAATVAREGIDIGIVAVPAECAQDVADDLVAAGVRGILNFAPRLLSVGKRVAMVNVDFRSALENLVHDVSQREIAEISEAVSKPVARRRRGRGAA
ncbi:MAG: redox-sensing transcriptional repressor Rex [Planctomycetota bacterium]